ncbi:MAG: serine/threonine-protein kinase, partial [Oceanococcaceae bacterium]
MNSSQAAPCWAVVEKALAAAQECEGATRARYLQDLSQDDPAVHAEVCALLSAVERSTVGGYLNGPRLTAKEPALPAHLPPGRVLGAWQLQDLIGRGGMGEVYLCERADGAFDMRAAVKILRAEARQHLERFAAERNIVAKLDHPGIARLLDGGLVDERPYMVMEYVAGLPINDYVRGHSLQLEAVLSLLAQVCAAVTHAHERGVIHRDLKPGNILVTADGRTKLVDFGIAKFVEPTNREAVTSTQAPMTVAYSAPEQLQGKTPTVATDVHGLGVVFYELLTGTLSWGEVDGVAISVLMQRIQRETPPPASARADPGDGRVSPIPASLLSGDLDAILRRALQKDPALRYPSVAELAADLARFRRGEAVAARATGTPPRLEVAERRQISVVCCDLDDATALSEDHDPEALHEGRVALHNTMTTLVEQYGGHLT